MAKSQNGFPASAKPAEIGVRSFTVPGTQVTLPIRADVAPRLLEMARWFHHNVEPLRKGECWGYAFRDIIGGTELSNHASGTAIDLNAPSHPLGKRGTVPAGKRAAISAKARELGLRWGGDFQGRVDEMHFEVVSSNGHAPGRPTIRRGSQGPAVREAQGILNRKQGAHLAVDGIFGPLTDQAVRSFQRRAGLVVDGIVGPKTWGRLLA
ncbi:peptidoglycan-binding protein [Actinophytocola sp. KF-1]